MLNQLPNYELSGEHSGQLQHMFNFFKTSLDIRARKKSLAWQNLEFNSKEMLCWIQEWYLLHVGKMPINEDPKKHSRLVHGFKEIRYKNPTILKFIMHVFPCAKFIISYRLDKKALQKSQRMVFRNKDKLRDEDQPLATENLLKFSEQHANQTFKFPLEWFPDTERWNSLFKWLQVGNCSANFVLQHHVNKTFKIDKRQNAVSCLEADY